MSKVIEAVYEDGVFKPLEKVELKEGERAKIIVESISEKTFGIIRVRKKDIDKILEEIDEEWGFY